MDTLVILTIIVFCGVYTPLSIYHIWKLYRCAYRKENPMKFLLKRQTALSIICCLAYCIQFFDLSVWSIAFTDWLSNEIEQTLIFICQFIHLLSQLTFTFTIVLRFWLLHYSIKFESISSNHAWKKLINPDYVINESSEHRYHSSNTEWILANNKTWGNLKFCLKTGGIVFVVLFVSICIAQVLHMFDDSEILVVLCQASSSFTYIVFLLIWSLMLAIHCRTPSFYDHLYIKMEQQHLFHIMIAFFFVYIIFAVLFGFSNDDVYGDGYFPQILLLFHCVALGNFITIHVLTYLPISKLQKFHNSNGGSCCGMLDCITSRSIVENKDTLSLKPNAHQIELEDVLKDMSGFSAFIKHLAHEFSTEILLSVTEFSMFKKHIYDNVNKCKKTSDITSDSPTLSLPYDKLPASKIVYNEEISNAEKAWKLWDKYVRIGAEYEINISGQLREYYRMMFENKQRWLTETSRAIDVGVLADLFDECITVNQSFMSQAFVRFKQSIEWENVVRVITTKQSIDVDPDYVRYE